MIKQVLAGLTAALIMSGANAEVDIKRWIEQNHAVPTGTDVGLLIRSAEYYAKITNLDKKLVLAVISVESGFNPKATNKGAKGLMQVQQSVHKKLIAGRDIKSVKVNLDVGTKILQACHTKSSGSIEKTLACYSGKKGKSAKGYVRLVQSRANQINAMKSLGGNNG